MEKAKKIRYLQTGIFVVLTGLLFTGISCNKDDDDKGGTDNVIFKATLNGANETPVNTSAATGDATLTFNQINSTFNIVVNYSGVVATGAHIHKGAPGVPGGIIFPFTAITSPINYTSAPLDSTQKADLFANMYYVNVHSAAYPGGEIRGQLTKQ